MGGCTYRLEIDLSALAVRVGNEHRDRVSDPSECRAGVWLVIFLICAYVIAKRRPTGRFVHGLLLGLANSAWITAAHVLFLDRYLAGHPQEDEIHVVSRYA